MLVWIGEWIDELRHRLRLQRWPAERAWGRRAEDLAHRYLQRAGMRVVARNFRGAPGGPELDLVAWDGPELVCVEVKSRFSEEFGGPERHADAAKHRAILRAARAYTRQADVSWEQVRIDLVTVVFEQMPRIAHYRAALPTTPPPREASRNVAAAAGAGRLNSQRSVADSAITAI
jgi:putative endonuclease